MYIYNEINNLINNDLKNYNKRKSTQLIITKECLDTIKCYTQLWAENETNRNLALQMAGRLDKKLYDHIHIIVTYDDSINIHEDFITQLKSLEQINEELLNEEEENLGFGKTARKLRKRWRTELRKIHKYLDKCYKNHINWLKEHRKPRRTYILKATGEVHNGLYWTLRELILNPKYIKYGFTKEK